MTKLEDLKKEHQILKSIRVDMDNEQRSLRLETRNLKKKIQKKLQERDEILRAQIQAAVQVAHPAWNEKSNVCKKLCKTKDWCQKMFMLFTWLDTCKE